jgi:hypothetical protein
VLNCLVFRICRGDYVNTNSSYFEASACSGPAWASFDVQPMPTRSDGAEEHRISLLVWAAVYHDILVVTAIQLDCRLPRLSSARTNQDSTP